MNWVKAACVASILAACGAPPAQDNRDYGPTPDLTAPNPPLLPTVNAARAIGWPENGAPIAPPGFVVTRYADGLDHPRWLYVLPDGGVLVAEASTAPQERGGVSGMIRNAVQRRAGGLGPSADRITLLADRDGDGRVEARSTFLENLHQPFGMVMLGDHFYVANTDAVLRFPYTAGAVRIAGEAETVLPLPYRADDNGHWTRNLIVSRDGAKLYVAVGSASNIGEYGMDAEEGRAAIWEFSPDGAHARIFASGLRNPVGMDWEPATGALWVAVNERDMLGDKIVPDYITSVREGGFYGWPYSYYGNHVDARVSPQRHELVAVAIAPDFAMGAHTASLGLMFYRGDGLPAHYRGGAFVAQHGSWNRSRFAGYRVVFLPFENGRPSGAVEDFLTGFLNDRNEAQGRPVGVAVDSAGAILVADDIGGMIWRVAVVS